MRLCRSLNIKLTLLSLFIALTTINAQEYKYEIGLSGGITGYMGDHYRSYPFGNLGYTFGALFRYNRDFRSALKVEGNIGTIDVKIQTNKLIDLSAQYEYNFFHYSDICKFKQTEIFTPYLAIGLGGTAVSYPQGQMGAAFYIPIGFGVKWKASKRLNLGAEYSVRWYLGDDLDNNQSNNIGLHCGKGNDWYNMLRVFITFDFGKRLCDCPIYYYKQKKGY